MSDGRDDVGSVGEEAAKLFDALQDWAKQSATGSSGFDQLGQQLGQQLGGQWGEQLRRVNEHVATGGADCTWCPVCQVISRVRRSSPEVRMHLAVAASSLLQAAASVLEAQAARRPAPASDVEHIDLDADDEPPEEEPPPSHDVWDAD